jgi:hypothetical protein
MKASISRGGGPPCQQSGNEHRVQGDCQHQPDPEMRAPKGSSHRDLIHRLSRSGHSAAQPGRISRRNPSGAPFAAGSTRWTPQITKAEAKTRPATA